MSKNIFVEEQNLKELIGITIKDYAEGKISSSSAIDKILAYSADYFKEVYN